MIVSELDFAVLRKTEDFQTGVPAEPIRGCQELFIWAAHIVILFPLRLGSMPFLEQVLRPGFPFAAGSDERFPKMLLRAQRKVMRLRQVTARSGKTDFVRVSVVECAPFQARETAVSCGGGISR